MLTGKVKATPLSKKAMQRIKGGYCNPSPFYQKPCTTNLQCGGSPCMMTLYCYIAPGASSGVCLFR